MIGISSLSRRVLMASVVLGTTAFAGVAGAQTIQVLSSRPELVTGGDALVRVAGFDAQPAVTVGGTDVSAAFRADAAGGWLGLVTGLKDGPNALVAKAGSKTAELTLTNHAVNATLFAGPQQEPFVCENESHRLAAAKDDTCAAPPRVDYYYRNRGGEWKPFDQNAARPTDIGMTKTSDGKDAPLIVRQEKGVINRSAYLINILHDPTAGPLPSPGSESPGSAWNRKLIYSFGGGVQANYHMGRNLGGMTGTDAKFFIEDMGGGLSDTFVTRGYAVAAGSLNVMGTNNDDVKSAETMAKIKEYFIEKFGQPKFTIGHGASGGSMQQHLIANSYPGLLDGIMPARSYPDVMTFLQPLYDCELIAKATAEGGWTYEQKGAVAGKYWGYCVGNGTRYPNARPTNCDASVNDLIANDPAVKARGVRCTFQDNLINVFGKDPATGFARNPFDNVGVQYGLVPLNEGKITFDQFLALNEKIGGLDINGAVVSKRMAGDQLALRRAYATGRVISPNGGLASVPIVDIRSYVDGDPIGVGDANIDVHDGYHSDVMRARMLKANGHAENHVVITTASLGRVQFDTRTYGSPLTRISAEGLALIDRWLTNLSADSSSRPMAEKLAAARPKELVDSCHPAKGGSLLGASEQVTDLARCKQLFPFAGDARIAAGSPLTIDVFKCQLRPVSPADYKAAPTADQLAKLKAIFPDGVCDFSKPGVEQVAMAGTWAVFKGDGEFTVLEPRR
jgi:hypothetical protein